MHLERFGHDTARSRLEIYAASGALPGRCHGVIGAQGTFVRDARTYESRLLPSNMAMLNLPLDCASLPDGEPRGWVLVGPHTRPREVPVSASGAWLITLFEPDVLATLVGRSAESLTDESVLLNDVPRDTPVLRDLRSIAQTGSLDRVVKDFCEVIPSLTERSERSTRPPVSSYRQWARRHRADFGMSPRQFGKIEKIQDAVKAMMGGAALSSVAAEAGYSDQSHMSRSFKATLGYSPSRFRKAMTESPIGNCYAAMTDHRRFFAL